MNTAEYVGSVVYPGAMLLLPGRMDTPQAKALVLAIGFQESGYAHRKQVGGPARGFWQFEEGGGLLGVLSHHASKALAEEAMRALVVRPWECFDAIVHNDVLACAFARLLLWTHPPALPNRDQVDLAWNYYRATWRPGKPHPETWEGNYARAWAMVKT